MVSQPTTATWHHEALVHASILSNQDQESISPSNAHRRACLIRSWRIWWSCFFWAVSRWEKPLRVEFYESPCCVQTPLLDELSQWRRGGHWDFEPERWLFTKRIRLLPTRTPTATAPLFPRTLPIPVGTLKISESTRLQSTIKTRLKTTKKALKVNVREHGYVEGRHGVCLIQEISRR